jgi:beta-1,4-N-acetylglucosaminyltransferase
MKKKKVMLVCSSGGHFLQLYTLSDHLCIEYDTVWVSFNKQDTRSMLDGKRHFWAFFPTNRNIPNLIRNTVLAWKLLRAERPNVVISTGAGISVPFLLLARAVGAKSIYVESFARRENISLTGKMVYRFVDRFYVQYEALTEQYGRAIYKGTIY